MNTDGFLPIQYFWVILAMLGVGLVSHFMDASPVELTVLKVAMVPVIALAAYAVERQFDVDEAYRRWSATFFERVLVLSFEGAAGVTFLLTRAESTLPELLGIFAWMFVVFALIATFGPLASRRSRKSKPGP